MCEAPLVYSVVPKERSQKNMSNNVHSFGTRCYAPIGPHPVTNEHTYLIITNATSLKFSSVYRVISGPGGGGLPVVGVEVVAALPAPVVAASLAAPAVVAPEPARHRRRVHQLLHNTQSLILDTEMK